MLRKLFEQFFAPTVSLGLIENGTRCVIAVTPSFDANDKLEGVDVEVMAPVPFERVVVEATAPVAGETNSEKPSPTEHPGNLVKPALGGAMELDPVTGQLVAKAAEQV